MARIKKGTQPVLLPEGDQELLSERKLERYKKNKVLARAAEETVEKERSAAEFTKRQSPRTLRMINCKSFTNVKMPR